MIPTHPQKDIHPGSVVGSDFEVYREGLKCFLRSRLNQDSDIEDCIQNVSLKWLEQGATIAPQATRAWLFAVAANEAAQMWRKRGRNSRAIERISLETSTTVETIDDLAKRETQLKVRQAIEQLPDDLRQVVTLRMESNQTFESIASQLNIPLGTALSRMHRALAKLERQLEPPE